MADTGPELFFTIRILISLSDVFMGFAQERSVEIMFHIHTPTASFWETGSERIKQNSATMQNFNPLKNNDIYRPNQI